MRGCGGCLCVVQADVAPGQPHLDVPVRELVVQLQCGLAEDVEQPQAQRRLERSAELIRDPLPLLVGDRCRRGEVGTERFGMP